MTPRSNATDRRRQATRSWLASASIGCLLGLCGALYIGCGYQPTARAVQSRPGAGKISLQVESHATDPGLPIALRRAMESSATPRGLFIVDGSPSQGLTLFVRILRVESRPITVTRLAAGDPDALAATGYEARVRLELTLSDGADPTYAQTTTIERAAQYHDQTLPIATDQARRAAIERALGGAGDDATAWLVAQQLSR